MKAAVLRSARLDGCFLGNASLQGAILDGVSAKHSDLKFADLSGASMSGVDLAGSELYGAVFRDSLISDVHWGLPDEFLSHHYHLAASVFRNLSSVYASASDYRQSDDFYYWLVWEICG